MRRYIIVALVLCVLGVGISLLLIPTEDEVVQLQQRDVAQIDLGNIDLQAEYTQGRRSFPIVNGLVEERIAAGAHRWLLSLHLLLRLWPLMLIFCIKPRFGC